MQKKWFLGLAFAAALGASATAAMAESNEEFYNRCKPVMPITGGDYCFSPFEALTQMADETGKVGQICFPSDNYSENALNSYVATYLTWVEQHPEQKQRNFFEGVNNALLEAFPCPDQ